MVILGIETSCDETAISLLEVNNAGGKPVFRVLGNAVNSQIDLHRQYGGVFPNLAKREHAKNLVGLLSQCLDEAGLSKKKDRQEIESGLRAQISKILEREGGLESALAAFLSENSKPDIDLISVTHGPGLEPALWVGVNFASALSLSWNVPVVPANHMEGHILASIVPLGPSPASLPDISFPLVALLVSGGHTELVLAKDWQNYEIVGQTKDDAAGEAFDKVARVLGLPYPGGPQISKLAREARENNIPGHFKFPRPMLHSPDLDFSFSGLKTSVLYAVKNTGNLSKELAMDAAREFEDAAVEVLVSKSIKAIEKFAAKTFIIGGGVSANTRLKEEMRRAISVRSPETAFMAPPPDLSTDNAVMIAAAGYFRRNEARLASELNLSAKGNLKLHVN